MADKKPAKAAPEISPYVFPILLAAFGLWCFYDGWLSTNPEMQEHALFNRVGSVVLLPWAAYDYWRIRRRATPPRDRHDPPKPDA